MFSKIILASGSPRRKQLLEWADISFDVIVSDADETVPEGMKMEEVAVYIAKQKAHAVLPNAKGLPILAADTIVVCNGQLLGKPIDRDDAISMISFLSGKEHVVITGVVICWDGKMYSFFDETRVWFNELTKEEIIFYVDRYAPFDKAGGYAIQEWIGVVGIKKIEGDFYNVMGLPISRVYRAFEQLAG